MRSIITYIAYKFIEMVFIPFLKDQSEIGKN